ncbi:hypothetical protein [Streptomyces triticirhizae]|uniref:Uncharacterized protein n=1 Tax=Streptomyces triticirhizae TaxID=2483353 RepID=A0A3M2LRZ2_9ACTN|nr:hypothetical protein [Streptomyces triticirhizae]RMI40167.1 hypothetical protein EBN88_13245 [Streptomyces triticirhizae]
MRPERFVEFACDRYPAVAGVKEVEPWSEGNVRPFGVLVAFDSGTRLWHAVTAQPPAGTEAPAGRAPEPVPRPELGEGRPTPLAVERFLVAAVTNAGLAGVARVWGYSEREPPASTPGFGVEFHDGARIFAPFVHFADPGQQRGAAYELAT